MRLHSSVTGFIIIFCGPGALMTKVISGGPDVGHYMEYFLATGNIRSRTGLGLQQVRFLMFFVCLFLFVCCCFFFSRFFFFFLIPIREEIIYQ